MREISRTIKCSEKGNIYVKTWQMEVHTHIGDFQGDARYGTGETIWNDGDKCRGLYLLDKFKEGRFKWNKGVCPCESF